MQRLLPGEDDHALVVFQALQQDFHFVADFDVVEVVELGDGDDAFGFIADVDEHFTGTDFEDMALDDGAFAEVLHGPRDEFLHSSHNGVVGPYG